MAKQTIQVDRELKQMDAKETDPSLLYVRELRGRSVNEESHMPPIRLPPQLMCMVQSKTQKLQIIAFHYLYVRASQHQLALSHLSQAQT